MDLRNIKPPQYEKTHLIDNSELELLAKKTRAREIRTKYIVARLPEYNRNCFVDMQSQKDSIQHRPNKNEKNIFLIA